MTNPSPEPPSCEVIVLTALPVEFAAVVWHLQDVQEHVHPSGTIYHQGTFAGAHRTWHIAVAEIGMGGTAAAAEAERAIQLFHPQIACFVGVAGGMKDVRRGDVVVATKVYAYEGGKAGTRFEPRPDLGHTSYALEQRARAEAHTKEWLPRLEGDISDSAPQVFIGAIAAGEKVLSSRKSSLARVLKRTYGDALAIEMEGHGFLHAVRLNQAVLGLVIRGISDLVDDKTEADASGMQAIAAQRAAAFAFQVLAKFMLPTPDHGVTKAPPVMPSPHGQTFVGREKEIIESNQDTSWADAAQGIHLAVEDLQNKESVPGKKKSQRQPPFPPVWNVPYRFSFLFTGREQVVEQLFTNFTSIHPSSLIPVQAISGLGGLGKTQTAVEYAYRYRQHYETVLWMNAETEDALLVSFRTAAELLKRPTAHLQNRQSLLASMQEWFRKTTDWLLIFDNADDITWMEAFLPQAASGHLLLTTRATAFGHVAQPLRLPPLAPDDGALFLLRRASYIPWTGQLSDASPASVKAANELSYLLDGLPLALEQAGAYIETTGRGVSGYLDLYRRYRAELQSREHSPVPTYRDPVAFAWNLARERVQQENPAALELLSACSFLAPHSIPYDLFANASPLFGPILEPVVAHPPAFDQAVAVLLKHSLIKNEVDKETDLPRLIIHPVLQEVLRDSMSPPMRHSWAEQIVQAVTQVASLREDPIMQMHLKHATLLLQEIRNG